MSKLEKGPQEEVRGSMRRWWRREEVPNSKSPRVPRSKDLKDPGSKGPMDLDISKSHSNTCLTLKKVHLVILISLPTYIKV